MVITSPVLLCLLCSFITGLISVFAWKEETLEEVIAKACCFLLMVFGSAGAFVTTYILWTIPEIRTACLFPFVAGIAEYVGAAYFWRHARQMKLSLYIIVREREITAN